MFESVNFSKYVPTIMPDRKMKMVWDMIILMIISFFFCIIPMQLSFDIFYDDEFEQYLYTYHINHSIAKFLVMIPEIFLIIDTLLKFVTGFYEDGSIIVDKSEICKHYLKKGLIFDILSYFPVIIQGLLRSQFEMYFPNQEFLIKYFQLLMVFKLKRVKIAISNFEEIIVSKGGHDFLLTAFQLMYVILFLNHLNACIWHAVAYFNSQSHTNTWLRESGLEGEYWLVKYLYSFYWAISMFSTIGYETKISPQNNVETFVGGLIMIASVLIFAFSINSMKQILDMMSKEENEYKYIYRISLIFYIY